MKKIFIVSLSLVILLSACFTKRKEKKAPAENKEYYNITVEYKDSRAGKVNLISEINNFNKKDMPLKKGHSGIWSIDLKLKRGVYLYKFYVDGKYEIDRKAEKIKKGGYYYNLLVVGEAGEKEDLLEEYYENQNSYKEKLKGLSKTMDMLGKVPEGSKTNFNFLAYGDCRTNKKVMKRVINMMSKEKAEFLLGTGDYALSIDEYEYWYDFLKALTKINFPIFLAVGNHDLSRSIPYNYYFDLVKMDRRGYQSFSYSDNLFIILNSEEKDNRSRITGRQKDFLLKELGKEYKNKFIVLHRPFFPPKYLGHHYRDSMNKYKDERDYWWEKFAENNVRAVFAGHEHFYNKQKIDNVYHIITGGGGAPLYSSKSDGGFYHYIKVKIKKDNVYYYVKGIDRKTDKWEIFDKFKN